MKRFVKLPEVVAAQQRVAAKSLPITQRPEADFVGVLLLNRRTVRKQARAKQIHPRPNLVRSSFYELGAPPHGRRIEVFNHSMKAWVAPDRDVQRRLNRMSDEQLDWVLRNMPFGFREAPEYDDDVKLDAVLDAALARGRLDLGGRSYRLRWSVGGHIVVNSAAGDVIYGREALLDVIQRGHF